MCSDLDPFPVKCEMDPNQGVTVINNENGGGVSILIKTKTITEDF